MDRSDAPFATGYRAILFRLRSKRSSFRFTLRILQRAELGGHAPRDRGSFAGVLEAGKIRPVPPREWTAQSLARCKSRVMDSIDQPLIGGRSLLVAREIAQISAGREQRRHTGNRRNFARIFHTFDGLNHFDEYDIVVDRIAISARNVAPDFEGLATALAALPEGGK